MRTLTALLATFDVNRAARFRGLVLGQLIRTMRTCPEPGLLHLFLLPPEPGQTRFTLYETAQPLNLEVPVPEAIRLVLEALHEAAGDPRQVRGADVAWRTIDPGRRGSYLGTGARFANPDPSLHGATIARLVDDTALYVTPASELQSSQPVIFNDEPYLATSDIPATQEAPFVLIDTIVGFLQ
jgi:hypothetical protein